MVSKLSSIVQQGSLSELQEAIRAVKGEKKVFLSDYVVMDAVRDAILLRKYKFVKLFLDEGVRADSYAHLEGQHALCKLMHFAGKAGSLALVKLLYDRKHPIKPDHYHDNQDGMRSAVAGGHTGIVKFLLDEGSPANGGYGGMMPFSFVGKAAYLGHVEICELLVDHGADIENAIMLLYEQNKFKREEDKAYGQALKLLLDFAQGVNFDQEVWGLFRNVDVTGFNFIGVSKNGKPIEKSDLKNIQGAEKALYTVHDLAGLEPARRELLEARAKGGVITQEGLVNLVPLAVAAKIGDADIVKVRLENGGDPNQAIPHEYSGKKSPIVFAANAGFEEVVTLLAHDPKIKPESLVTAAQYAQKYPKIQALLKPLYSVDQVDEDGCAPIHNAVIAGNVEEVKALIAQGADVTKLDGKSRSPLLLSIAPYSEWKRGDARHLEIFKLLLPKVDPNQYKWTSPLNYAFEFGNLEAASLLMPLMEKKPDNEGKPWYAELMYRTIFNFAWQEMFDLLKENGADFNARLKREETLLYKLIDTFAYLPKELDERQAAALKKSKEMLSYLLTQQADPNQLVNGHTALERFIQRDLGFPPDDTKWVIEQFLQHGFKLEGRYLLHLAVKKADEAAVEYLVAKCDVNEEDAAGKIPLNYAENERIRKLLTHD